ncbi:MAG: TonB-dependent receptor plug domain-containing protein, partial [Pyrinomonadaceae bacterium]
MPNYYCQQLGGVTINSKSAGFLPRIQGRKLSLFQFALIVFGFSFFPPSAHAEENAINLHIPAQPLASALEEYSHRTGTQLIFRPEAVAGYKSRGLEGRYTISGSLKQLLKGTALTIQQVNNHTLAIKDLEQGSKSVTDNPNTEDATLPKVTVEADSEYDPEYYTDPYNKDYVIPNATAGTKTDTPIMETPLNVQVISKQVLKERQSFTLTDALRNVSGVRTDPFPGGNTRNSQSIFLRGFDSQTFFRDGFR